MHTAFQHNQYLLKRQVFALAGKFRVYDPAENLVLFSEQKMFRHELDLDFNMDPSRMLDRRLGLAAGILLATVEGKQSN